MATTVQMLVPIAGNAEPAYGLPDFSFAAGETVTLDSVLAEQWIASGMAVAVPVSNSWQCADNEPPAGVMDGVNAIFTLYQAPNPPGSLMLFKNGQKLRAGAGNDFTLSGRTITFAKAPQGGNSPDSLEASYRY